MIHVTARPKQVDRTQCYIQFIVNLLLQGQGSGAHLVDTGRQMSFLSGYCSV